MRIRTRKPAVTRPTTRSGRRCSGWPSRWTGRRSGWLWSIGSRLIDVAAIRAYCEIVFRDPPPGGMIALWGFAESKGSSDNKVIDWVDPCAKHWVKGVASFVGTRDRRGCSAYCTPGFVNGRRAMATDVLTLPTLVIDFDKGDFVENCCICGRQRHAEPQRTLVQHGARPHDHLRATDPGDRQQLTDRPQASAAVGTDCDDSRDRGRAAARPGTGRPAAARGRGGEADVAAPEKRRHPGRANTTTSIPARIPVPVQE